MNLYFRYHKHHWKSWLSAAIFTIFFGPAVLVVNWIFISCAYLYDRHRAEKEINQEHRHREIIDAINKRNWPASVEYKKEQTLENIKGPWGEA